MAQLRTEEGERPAWTARKLLRAARAGSLATVSPGGHPGVSLVTPAAAPDGSLLMLLSGLSEHTRHLRNDGRCSLMVTGAPDGANPQTAPRVSVIGTAAVESDPALKARWVAVHPYAAFYADFGDFALWRLRPEGAGFVGGFARAARLSREDLAPDPAAVAAIGAAEAEIVAHCNADHPDALAVIAGAAAGADGGWRMVAADVDGTDLASGEHVLRVAWSAPVSEAGDVRRELIRLARASREESAGRSSHPTRQDTVPNGP